MKIILSLALASSQALACSPEQESILNRITSWVKSKTEVCIESILIRKIDKKKAIGVNILGNPLVCEAKNGEIECTIKSEEEVKDIFLKKTV